MAKENVVLTKNELKLLETCIDMAIASAKRAQNASKNPQLSIVHNAIQREYTELKIKVAQLPYM